MEYEIVWEPPEVEDVRVVVRGQVELDGLDAWVQEALADRRYRAGLRVLIDHRLAEWDQLTHEQIRRRADAIERYLPQIGGRGHRVAWVAGRTVDYGLGRMLGTLTEGRRGVEFQAFDDVEEARRWLAGPGETRYETSTT